MIELILIFLKWKIYVSILYIIISSVFIYSIKIEVWFIYILKLILFFFDNLVVYSRLICMVFYCGNFVDYLLLELVFYFLVFCLCC